MVLFNIIVLDVRYLSLLGPGIGLFAVPCGLIFMELHNLINQLNKYCTVCIYFRYHLLFTYVVYIRAYHSG